MGKYDMLDKDYFTEPERMAELIRNGIYHGRVSVLPGDLRRLKQSYPSLTGSSGELERDGICLCESHGIKYGLEIENYGNYYPDAKVYWTSSVYSKIGEVKCNTYVLNGEYKHFNAVLMIHGDWKYASSNPGTTFYVIGDDEELFSTYVSNDSDSIYIDIDITGINKLKIGMDGGKYAYLYLGNAVVYKQYGSIEE